MFILARLGFFDCLPDEIKYYPYKPLRRVSRGSNNAILEVTEIKSEKDAINKIDLVESAIKRNTDYSQSQVLDICTMVSEMLQNIFVHSEAKRHGLISIQAYPHLRNVQLVIADSGIGIPETIRTAEEFKEKELTDEAAIVESVKKGVSRFGRRADRGEGLSRCLQLSAKHSAKLYIRSNGGYAFFSFQHKKKFSSSAQFLRGTQIFVNFPMMAFST
ncbi:MAG: ATP-binding protein [Ignavibacteriae bacterium]|nr:ATP-binding protein [Ignavibacteriota bacterium]